MAMLVLHHLDGQALTYPVSSGRVTIGRAPDCGIVLEDSFVSRHHAVIILQRGAYLVQDLDSKNGTWINRTRLGALPQRLSNGDTITLGNARVTLRFLTDDTTLTLSPETGLLEISVDTAGREVYVRGDRLSPPLTRKEFDILAFLWERRGEACARDELAARGWPEREGGDISDAEIEQYIRRLRRRLGDGGSQPQRIVTVRRYGYKLI